MKRILGHKRGCFFLEKDCIVNHLDMIFSLSKSCMYFVSPSNGIQFYVIEILFFGKFYFWGNFHLCS